MNLNALSRKELFAIVLAAMLSPLLFFGSGLWVGMLIADSQHADSEGPARLSTATEKAVPDGPTPKTTDMLSTDTDQDKTRTLDLYSDPDSADQSSITMQLKPLITVEEALSQQSGDAFAETVTEMSPPEPVLSNRVAEDIPVEQAVDIAMEEPAEQDRFAAQVGVFSDKTRAENWQKLLDQRFEYEVVIKHGTEGKEFFAIVIGPYKSRAEASVIADRYRHVTTEDAFVITLESEPQTAVSQEADTVVARL